MNSIEYYWESLKNSYFFENFWALLGDSGMVDSMQSLDVDGWLESKQSKLIALVDMIGVVLYVHDYLNLPSVNFNIPTTSLPSPSEMGDAMISIYDSMNENMVMKMDIKMSHLSNPFIVCNSFILSTIF